MTTAFITGIIYGSYVRVRNAEKSDPSDQFMTKQ